MEHNRSDKYIYNINISIGETNMTRKQELKTFTIPDELYQRFSEQCKKEYTNASQMIRKLMDEYLKSKGA